jgi:hypothetical protein
MVKIIEKCDRNRLCEGRNWQMGFAMLKKTAEDTYETVVPISPCKDYLNDVIFSEATGLPLQVYGASTKKTGIFETEPMAYMGFKICPKFGSKTYNGMEADILNLEKNIKNIETLINYVEEQFKLKERSTFHKAEEGHYLAIMPMWWVKYTYLISLYTLLVRMAQFWNGEGTAQQYLDKYSTPLDKSLWDGAKPAYKFILEDGLYKQDLSKWKSTDSYTIHNCGIVGINTYLKTK